MGFGQSVIALSAGAMLLGIILSLIPEGTERRLAKLAGSLILTMTALRALTNVDLPRLDVLRQEFQGEASQVSAMGYGQAQQARLGRIKTLLESYILDKAAALEAAVELELKLDDQGLPESAALRGQWSQYARQRLERMLAEELGIPKEKQQWILEN